MVDALTDDGTLTPEQRRALEERLLEAAEDGRVPCSVALAIAESLSISPAEVGQVAERLSIRFSNCRLGCF